jgi:hypothetical protein
VFNSPAVNPKNALPAPVVVLRPAKAPKKEFPDAMELSFRINAKTRWLAPQCYLILQDPNIEVPAAY